MPDYLKCLVPVAALALATLFAPKGAEAREIYGLWTDPDWNAVVRLFDCDGDLCGEIVGLPEDVPNKDLKNPDPALRGRPLIGLRILEGYRRVSEDTWIGGGDGGRLPGRIYVPTNGDTLGDDKNSYTVRHTSRDTLSIGLKDCTLTCLLNRVWTRAE